MPSPKPWSKKAKRALLHGIGFYGLQWFREQGGPAYDYPNAPKIRSRGAVYQQARRLFGPGGLTRGVNTPTRLAASTGYAVTQIKRAAHALNQKWKRLGPKGIHLLTDEQTQDILEWLKHDYWVKSLRLYACIWCGSHTKVHKGGGLCNPCYYRHRAYCKKLGIPHSVTSQAEWAQKAIRLDRWTDEEVHFLEMARNRLTQGKSLSRSELDWIGMLYGA